MTCRRRRCPCPPYEVLSRAFGQLVYLCGEMCTPLVHDASLVAPAPGPGEHDTTTVHGELW